MFKRLFTWFEIMGLKIELCMLEADVQSGMDPALYWDTRNHIEGKIRNLENPVSNENEENNYEGEKALFVFAIIVLACCAYVVYHIFQL